MTTTTTNEIWTAREAYDLTIYQRSADGLRVFVGDGTCRYWVNAAALNDEVTLSLGTGEDDAAAYARWCSDNHASDES